MSLAPPATERRVTRAQSRAQGLTPGPPSDVPARGAATEPRLCGRGRNVIVNKAPAAAKELFAGEEDKSGRPQRSPLVDATNRPVPPAQPAAAEAVCVAPTVAKPDTQAPETPRRPAVAAEAGAEVDVVKSILTPEPPLTPSVAALREDSAAHVPSPAAALSPIPKNAHLSLPFVPRCVQNKQLAKELRAASSPKGAGSRQQHAASSPRGASPRSLSMGQLRRQVREKTIDHRGRWPLASSSSTAASSMQEETEEVSTAAPPRQTPRPKLQLESVIVQQRKPCQPCAGTEPSIADDEDTASVQTHTLSGLPQGSGCHTRFEDSDEEDEVCQGDENASPEGAIKLKLRGLPSPCGTHTRFTDNE